MLVAKYSLVPRPCPAFRRLQYGKVGFFVCIQGEATAGMHRQIIYMYIVIIPTEYCAYMYRIALNFRGSKFSRIAIFEDFVEIISRTHCTRTLHAVCQKFLLKYFREQLEIREIKDPRKFSAIQYIVTSTQA